MLEDQQSLLLIAVMCCRLAEALWLRLALN